MAYRLHEPDGERADQDALKVFGNVARDLRLGEDEAQRVVDRMVPALRRIQSARLTEMSTEWTKQSKSDAFLTSGQGFDANVKLAKQAIAKFGDAELKEVLDGSGLGSHPAVLRFVAKVAHALAAKQGVVVKERQQTQRQQPRGNYDDADAQRLYSKPLHRLPNS